VIGGGWPGWRLRRLAGEPRREIFFCRAVTGGLQRLSNSIILPIKQSTMQEDEMGMIIGGIAVAGGLAIGAIVIIVSVPWSMKEKLARLEARNKERMALIEKGLDPEQFFKEKKRSGGDPLFWGFLLAGLGLGLLVGYLLALSTGWDVYLLTNAMAIFLGGVAMIVYNFYSKKQDDQRRS
jgi:hypothetical protein